MAVMQSIMTIRPIDFIRTFADNNPGHPFKQVRIANKSFPELKSPQNPVLLSGAPFQLHYEALDVGGTIVNFDLGLAFDGGPQTSWTLALNQQRVCFAPPANENTTFEADSISIEMEGTGLLVAADEVIE